MKPRKQGFHWSLQNPDKPNRITSAAQTHRRARGTPHTWYNRNTGIGTYRRTISTANSTSANGTTVRPTTHCPHGHDDAGLVFQHHNATTTPTRTNFGPSTTRTPNTTNATTFYSIPKATTNSQRQSTKKKGMAQQTTPRTYKGKERTQGLQTS